MKRARTLHPLVATPVLRPELVGREHVGKWLVSVVQSLRGEFRDRGVPALHDADGRPAELDERTRGAWCVLVDAIRDGGSRHLVVDAWDLASALAARFGGYHGLDQVEDALEALNGCHGLLVEKVGAANGSSRDG